MLSKSNTRLYLNCLFAWFLLAVFPGRGTWASRTHRSYVYIETSLRSKLQTGLSEAESETKPVPVGRARPKRRTTPATVAFPVDEVQEAEYLRLQVGHQCVLPSGIFSVGNGMAI